MNAETVIAEGKDTAACAARILVVEDERIVARSLRNQLTALGYEVLASVASGEEAIHQTDSLRPDLVLMDISLDGQMDGVKAAAIIRQRFRLPVIYLTAYSNKEILERAKVTEPYGYILKPYEERELHVVIEMALYKHRMERRQQDRERWFVATLASIGDAVVASDDEGRITYMNPLAERLTGWASQDALGEILTDIVRLVQEDSGQPVESPLDSSLPPLGKGETEPLPTLGKRATEPLSTLAKGGSGAGDQALQGGTLSTGILLIAKDRSAKAIENCVSLITDEHGVALGGVMVFRDVTWRKHLEGRFRQAKKMEAIGRLAGGVAHALNNLTTVVLGNSEIMLNEMKRGDPFFTSAQEIERAATRTAALTQKLQAFGRKQILTLRSVDVNAVIGGVTKVIRHMLGDVRLELSLEPGLGTTRADADQLEEAILTLVQNSCDAMPQGGKVAIQTADVELGQEYIHDHSEVRPGPYVLLAVSDTGVGMDQEAISHLFEPFFTKEASVGAGLGLAAIYGFVKQCGGDIEVQSQPKKGTTFRLYLPREC